MKSRKPNPKRVLAIDPTSKGFGFVVLESSALLVDWSVKTTRDISQENVLAKIVDVIRLYQPEVLVLEDYKKSRRCPRIRSLLDASCQLAKTEGLKRGCIPLSLVKKMFRTFGAKNKHEIAHAVAQQLPELAPELPPCRKPWESEDYHMAIFDAAAFALTYFYSRPLRSGVPQANPEPTPNGLNA